MICAITGANGYAGTVISNGLRAHHFEVVPIARNPASKGIEWSFESAHDITGQLRERRVEALLHAAWDMKRSDLASLRRICVDGSKRLIEQATRAGVKRLVFFSTISAFDGARSAYGISKLEVERMVLSSGGGVLRPGLIHSTAEEGGLFGTLRVQVRKSKFVPLIGDGQAPQFMLHRDTLIEVVSRALRGELPDFEGRPALTLANPQPIPFRSLLLDIAAREGRRVTPVPIPWRCLYGALRSAEWIGLNPGVRSDSVLSFVYQNGQPDFSGLTRNGIQPKPYDLIRAAA